MGLDGYIQLFFSGITIGSIYAMVALGFLLIYSSTGIINLAQGEFVMLGGMIAVTCNQTLHMPLWMTFIVSALSVTAIGAIFELVCIHPLKNASVLGLIMITIAASIVMRGTAMFVWGKEEHGIPPFSGSTPVDVFGASIHPQVLWILGVIIVALVLLFLMFRYTLTGKAMQAVADNKTASRLVGINVRKIVLLSFALSAGLGAIAGVLLTPMTLMSYDRGAPLALKGFAAAVAGGLGNPAGAVAAGLFIGLLESFGAGLLSSQYTDVFALVIIIIVLCIKPEGIFSSSGKAQLKKF